MYYVPLRTSVVYTIHPCMCYGAMYNLIYSCWAACMSTNTRIECLMSLVLSIDLFRFEDAQLWKKFKESNIAYLNNALWKWSSWSLLTCVAIVNDRRWHVKVDNTFYEDFHSSPSLLAHLFIPLYNHMSDAKCLVFAANYNQWKNEMKASRDKWYIT